MVLTSPARAIGHLSGGDPTLCPWLIADPRNPVRPGDLSGTGRFRIFFRSERRRNVAQVRRRGQNALHYRAFGVFALHEDFLTKGVDNPDWEGL